MNTNKIATGSVNKKLLAALAVLAVAFVVLAAVPVVAESDSDAALTTGSNVYVDPDSTASDPTGAQTAPYTTVYDALKAIGGTTGKTVILLKDSTEVSFTVGAEGTSAHGTVAKASAGETQVYQNVTIDLNGHTLTISEPAVGSNGYESQAFRVLDGNTVTIKNGTMDVAVQSGDHKVGQMIHNYGNLTLTDVKIDGTNVVAAKANEFDQKNSGTANKAVTLQTESGVVVINGSTSIIAPAVSRTLLSYALVVDGGNSSYQNGTQVTINTTGSIGKTEIIRNAENTSSTDLFQKTSLTIQKATFTDGIQVFGTNEYKDKLTITGDVTADIEFKGNGNNLTVAKGGSYSGTVTYDKSKVSFENLKSSTGAVVVAAGEAKNLSIALGSDNTGNSAAASVSGVTVSDGTTLTLDSTLSVSKSVAVNDGGYLYTSDDGKISLARNATLTLEADGAKKTPAVEPVVLTAKAASVLTTSDEGVLTEVSGNVELTSGRLVVGEGSMVQTAGTFTVASGAVLDASESSEGLTVGGTFNVAGEIVFQKLTINEDASVSLKSGSVSKYVGSDTNGIALYRTEGSSASKLTQEKGAVFGVYGDADLSQSTYDAVKALTTVTLYKITNASENTSYTLYFSGLSVDAADVIAYVTAGETVFVDVIPAKGSILNGVSADKSNGAADDGSTAFALKKSGSYTYTFSAPAYDVTVSAQIGGSLTATFVLVFDDGTADEVYWTQSGIVSGETPVLQPQVPVRDGYRFVAWYTNAACTNEIRVYANIDQNTIYYGKMVSVYDVDTSSVIGQGTLVANPASAVYNGLVTITATPASGWALDSLTVDGKAVKIDKVWEINSDKEIKQKTGNGAAYDKYAGSAFVYYIYMPDADVAVSAVFKELFDVTWTNPEKVGDEELGDDKGITGVDKAADGAKSAQYLAGDTVKVTIAAPEGYAVLDVIVTDTDGAVLKLSDGDVKVVTKNDVTTYDFAMPAKDVVVTATYNQTIDVAISVTDAESTSGASVGFLGKTITASTGSESNTVAAAMGAKVVVTLTPAAKGYAVSELKVDGTVVDISLITYDAKGVGSYTYTVPSSGTASIDATFGPIYKIEKVTQAGAGNADYDTENVSGVAGTKFAFTVRTADDIMLQTITVKGTSTNSTINEIYRVNGTAVSGEVTESAYWTVNGDVYTFEMPASNVTIAFVFGDAVYYPITISEGSEVTVYSNPELTAEVPDLTKALKGTYYIVVKQKTGYDVNDASAKYTKSGPQTTGTAFTYTKDKAVDLTRISLTAEQGVYSFDLVWDTTITAQYKAHTSTVTIQDVDNGKITVTQNGVEVKDGGLVDYDSVLTITVTADDGYSVSAILVNGTAIEGSTYTVKMDNVTIGATTALAYAITVTADDGVSVTPSKTSASAGESIVLTIAPKSGYDLESLTVDGQTVTVTGSTYTFEMPGHAVAVVATSTEEAPAADNVTVSFVNMNGVTKVQVAAIDGYIPAGKVTITAWYSFTLAGRTVADSFTITVDIAGGEGKYVEIADITTDNEHAATLFGGSAHYVATAGDVNSYDSPMTTITLAAAEA